MVPVGVLAVAEPRPALAPRLEVRFRPLGTVKAERRFQLPTGCVDPGRHERRPAPHGAIRLISALARQQALGGLRAVLHRSRSVRRLVTNPICVAISGSRSTRSVHRLGRYSELAPVIVSRAISRCKVGLEITGDTTTGAGAE